MDNQNNTPQTAKYLAHSGERGHQHLLKDHLLSTAHLSSRFAEGFGSKEIAYYLGLWHDLGKYHPDFQKYIREPKKNKKTPHSAGGSLFAREKKIPDCFLFPIAGHHSGLTDLCQLKTRLTKNRDEGDRYRKSMQEAQKDFPDLISHKLPPPEKILPAFLTSSPLPNPDKKRKTEFFIRMLFSCLVDADFLDTENYFQPQKGEIRTAQEEIPFEELLDIFVKDQESFMTGKEGELNQIRKEIYDYCIKAGKGKPGIYRLSVPTGGGKTRSSLAFALQHSVINNMSRIIYSIPYTSIIEQTAEVLRNIFEKEEDKKDKVILEHHCGLEYEDIHDTDTNQDKESQYSALKLASENWDGYPVIVTTNVQLFESLFANKSSRCRKLHNIAKSVIILDEVQTLPLELLTPTLDVLQTLVDDYGVTVVLCTATQPALDSDVGFRGLKDVKDILPDNKIYFDKLKRVEYDLHTKEEPWSWNRVIDEMLNSPQALCILNTRKQALSLVSLMKEKMDEKGIHTDALFHLSTNLCPAHRRDVLTKIKERLTGGQPCYLISTQVVEAGVDIDFPLVLRAMAPLDRIVQSAGRCNREGKLRNSEGNPSLGKVIIFNPEEKGMPPGTYRSGYCEAQILLSEEGIDMEDPSIYQRYFRRLYTDVDLDSPKIQQDREDFNFTQVSSKYHIIDDNTVSVIVCYGNEDTQKQIKKNIEKLNDKFSVKRNTMRKLQQYIVNINGYNIPAYEKDGLLEPVMENLYNWRGKYHELLGIRETAINPDLIII